MKKSNKILTALVIGSLLTGATAMAEDLNVSYDNDKKDSITLTTSGVTINNVNDGYVLAGSKQAVNGGQLYEVNRQIDKLSLNMNDMFSKTNVSLSNIVAWIAGDGTEDGKGIDSKASTAYMAVKNGYDFYVNGKDGVHLGLSNTGVNFIAGDNVTIDTKGENGLKFSVAANGEVKVGNEGLVTGGMVMDAINQATAGLPTDVNVANKADKDLSNLSDSGVTKISQIANDAANAAVGNKADVDAGNINESVWQKKLATNTIEEDGMGLVTSGLLYDAMVGLDNEYAYKDATNMTDANVVAWQEKLSVAKRDASNIDKSAWQTVLGDGINASGNTGLITGDTLNKALANIPTTGGKTYVGSDTISISDAGEVSVKTSGKVEAGNTGLVSGGQVEEAIKKATENIASDATVAAKADKTYVDDALSKKADADKVYTKDETDTKINDAISGVSADVSAKADKSYVDNALADKVDKSDFDAVKNQVDKNTADIANKADKSYVDDELSKKADADKVYTKDETDSKISDAISGVNTTLDNKADKSYVDNELAKKADKDTVTNLEGRVDKQDTAIAGLKDGTGIDVDGYSKTLGVGQVAEGNTGLVNGDAVYGALNELKETTGMGLVTITDGTVTVAKDSEATKVDFAGKNGNRVLTGVETDVNDVSSAANVGYVNSQAQALEAGMNAMGAKLSDEVKNAGAVGAALAGLHQLDYDPDNKLDVAASVGHYRGKNAGAIGFFYRPNENFMISAGATIGADDNAYNAGLSFKLGKGSSYGSTSKAAMAAEIRQLKADKDAQAEEIQELKAQVAFLMQKMELSDKVEKTIVK